MGLNKITLERESIEKRKTFSQILVSPTLGSGIAEKGIGGKRLVSQARAVGGKQSGDQEVTRIKVHCA